MTSYFIFRSTYKLTSLSSRQGSVRQTRTKMLILSTILLYLSTGTSLIALMWNRSQANNLVLGAASGLFSPSYDGLQEMEAFKAAVWKQSWMTAITLVWNVRRVTSASTTRCVLIPPLRHSASLETQLYGGACASFGETESCTTLDPSSSASPSVSTRCSYYLMVVLRLIPPLCSASLGTASPKSRSRRGSRSSSRTMHSSRLLPPCRFRRTLSRPL